MCARYLAKLCLGTGHVCLYKNIYIFYILQYRLAILCVELCIGSNPKSEICPAMTSVYFLILHLLRKVSFVLKRQICVGSDLAYRLTSSTDARERE